MDVKMINIEKLSNTENINNLVPPETVIPQKCSININISEIAITAKGVWINTRPDYIVFESNEGTNGVPPKGAKCMFCKNKNATMSHNKIINIDNKQYAGYRYCDDCYIKYL